MTKLVGEEAAGLLVNQLPPSGWDQMATKSNLAELKGKLKGDMADPRGDMADLKSLNLDAAMCDGCAIGYERIAQIK